MNMSWGQFSDKSFGISVCTVQEWLVNGCVADLSIKMPFGNAHTAHGFGFLAQLLLTLASCHPTSSEDLIKAGIRNYTQKQGTVSKDTLADIPRGQETSPFG